MLQHFFSLSMTNQVHEHEGNLYYCLVSSFALLGYTENKQLFHLTTTYPLFNQSIPFPLHYYQQNTITLYRLRKHQHISIPLFSPRSLSQENDFNSFGKLWKMLENLFKFTNDFHLGKNYHKPCRGGKEN